MPKSDAIRSYVVSVSGRMSLPADVRRRWRLDRGGSVDVLDLGFGVLTVPSGQGARLLRDLLPRKEQARIVASLEDSELGTT
jgi:bifunctional DNA-binding transcriptional regulator/antitoxin component of YhaV-PrlF toxin-antitoxin module